MKLKFFLFCSLFICAAGQARACSPPWFPSQAEGSAPAVYEQDKARYFYLNNLLYPCPMHEPGSGAALSDDERAALEQELAAIKARYFSENLPADEKQPDTGTAPEGGAAPPVFYDVPADESVIWE